MIHWMNNRSRRRKHLCLRLRDQTGVAAVAGGFQLQPALIVDRAPETPLSPDVCPVTICFAGK
jgi:hypothetical protein